MDAFNLYQSFKFCILYFSIYPGFATSIMLVTHFENLRLVSSSSFPKCKPAIFYISFSFFYSNTVRVDAIDDRGLDKVQAMSMSLRGVAYRGL